MKVKRVVALLLALTVGLMALPAVSLTALAADQTVLLDTNNSSAIKKAGFTADQKKVNKTKYSAKWKVDEAADKKVAGIPLDFSKHSQISFSIMAESSENATVMVYFGSENKGTDGIDYWSSTVNLKPGEWQDVTIKYSDLKANREPLGWDKLSELSFRTLGWSNKAAAGTVVYIENIVLSGAAVGAGSSTTTPTAKPSGTPGEENADNKTKAFYFGDYNDKNAGISTGASVMPKSNSITHEFDGDNGFVKVDVTSEADDCYIEASLKSTKVNNLIVEMSLSTDGKAPSGNLQYKDTSSDRKQGTLFSIDANGGIIFKGDTKPAATLKKGTWVKLGFVMDLSKYSYTAYLDDKKVGTFALAETSNDLAIMRMYIEKKAENVGKSLLIDNFAVYGGTEFRDVSGEYDPGASSTPSGGKIVAKVGTDVPMQHPSLDELKGGVALMLDIPAAYANGALTKVDVDNDAVVPYT